MIFFTMDAAMIPLLFFLLSNLRKTEMPSEYTRVVKTVDAIYSQWLIQLKWFVWSEDDEAAGLDFIVVAQICLPATFFAKIQSTTNV